MEKCWRARRHQTERAKRDRYGSTGNAVSPVVSAQAEHQVHVLDRLAGGALDEVVLDDQDQRHVAALRPVHGDPADVRRAHRARIGRRSGRHHVDEGLALVTPLEQRLQVGAVSVSRA